MAYQDEGAKETFSNAWSAGMVKFFEDVSLGLADYDEIGDYVKLSDINELLGKKGKLNSLTYNASSGTFSVQYTTKEGINYIGEIDEEGRFFFWSGDDWVGRRGWSSI